MVIRIDLDAASVARVRVAVSPIFETVSWLAAVATGTRHQTFGDAGAAARFALRDKDVALTAGLLVACAAQQQLPDFLLPQPNPARSRTQLEEQLTVIAETPSASVINDVPRQWLDSAAVSERRLDLKDIPSVLANGLHRFRRLALAESWWDLERGLSDQLERCGMLLADGGVDGLFASLRPDVQWNGDSLLLAKSQRIGVSLNGDDLLVIPSLLSAHRLIVGLEGPGGAWLAFGSSTARRRQPVPPHQPPLLGRTRTGVLAGIDTPHTTRQLAAALGIGESTVSHHLKALSRAGLATAQRRGREVRYVLTPLGRRLLSNAR